VLIYADTTLLCVLTLHSNGSQRDDAAGGSADYDASAQGVTTDDFELLQVVGLSYTPLVHSSHTLLSYTPLIHSSHTLLSYTPLIHSSHTLLSYTLLQVVGKGGFGKVFLVQKKTGKKKNKEEKIYAMKVLVKSQIFKDNQVEHTAAERRILAGIDHPFVVRLSYAFQVSVWVVPDAQWVVPDAQCVMRNVTAYHAVGACCCILCRDCSVC
jgi:hypothetical protein